MSAGRDGALRAEPAAAGADRGAPPVGVPERHEPDVGRLARGPGAAVGDALPHVDPLDVREPGHQRHRGSQAKVRRGAEPVTRREPVQADAGVRDDHVDAAEVGRQLDLGAPIRVLATLSEHRLGGRWAGVPTAGSTASALKRATTSGARIPRPSRSCGIAWDDHPGRFAVGPASPRTLGLARTSGAAPAGSAPSACI